MNIIDDTIYLKLVFFGTALAGKTTILEWLFDKAIPDEMKLSGEIRQIKTSFGQTLLFDFVPIRLSDNAVVRIYTSTGQDYYAGTRSKFLSDTDGIFLVVDSQKKELEHNVELLEELHRYFKEISGLEEAEVVVLFNKQDLDDIYPVEYLKSQLGINGWPAIPTSALTGENLMQSLLLMLKTLTSKLREQGIDLT
jgi:signal recognition particle receptor subunit beta